MQFLRLLLLNQDVSRLETKSCAKIMLAKVTNLGQNLVLLYCQIVTIHTLRQALHFCQVQICPMRILGNAYPIDYKFRLLG